jgi:putative MATE family efflux protein
LSYAVSRSAYGGRGTLDRTLERWFGTTQLDYRAVFALLGPVVLSQAFVLGFSALSPLLVAPAGIEAISAVSTVEYLNVFLLSVLVALAMAGAVLVAQHEGHGDHDAVRRAAVGARWAAVLPAVGFGAVILAAQGPLLGALLGATGDRVLAYGHIYLTGAALSYPAFAIVEASSAALRGIARTRTALYLTIVMNGAFLILATGLVYGAGLGVTGLTIALVVARYLAAGVALVMVRRDPLLGMQGSPAGTGVPTWAPRMSVGSARWRPDRAVVRQVVIIGIPFVAEQVFFNGGKLIVQTFIVGMGTVSIAANAVAQSLLAVSEIVAAAMSIALVPIVGQAIGAGRPDDARRIIRSFVWASSAVPVVVAAVMLTFFGSLLDLFRTPAGAARDVTVIFVAVTASRLLGTWSGSFLLPSGLRAAGDTVYTTTVATCTMTFRVTMAWVVGVHWGYGVVGVWVVMIAEWALRSLFFGVRFHGTRWEKRSFVGAEPVPAGCAD